jgi:hypothetical protein
VTELHHVELLAAIDSLVAELRAWSESAPPWPPARECQALVRRLAQRADALRVRIEAPLVVATLGGTGTGKSSLVNALVGDDVTAAGRERPTTRQPTLITAPGLGPADLGIEPAEVRHRTCDAPLLRQIALLDCPDPDTTEDGQSPGTNLARLRRLLPHCDVLLVTTTQQKYRSARVADELAAAAPGARLVFVQTHAALDADIRGDWRQVLGERYALRDVLLVDSLEALADRRAGRPARGDFARLEELLTGELVGAASRRIRRANFLDLAAATLERCGGQLDVALPAVEALEQALAEQRARLAARWSAQLRDELLASRRLWEQRLLAEVSSRWGLSPFALVLRAWLGLGSLVSGWALWRARSAAQVALWGAVEGTRRLARRRSRRRADAVAQRALSRGLNETDLRTAAIIVDGYADEAGLPRPAADAPAAARAAADFLAAAAAELQGLLSRLADRHARWRVRWRYELAVVVMLGALVYRLGRNFFWDSWLAADLGFVAQPAPLLGTDFFLQAAFWGLGGCGVLVWLFAGRLQRGLRGEIARLAESWAAPAQAADLFGDLESHVRQVRRWRDERLRLASAVAAMRGELAHGGPLLGHLRQPAAAS